MRFLNVSIRSGQPLFTTIGFFILTCMIRAGAQEHPVQFSQTVMSLSAAIESIESQTDYSFVYNTEMIDLSREITLPAGRHPLADILRLLEPQIGYHLHIKLNYIVVYTAEPYRVADSFQPPPSRTADQYQRSDPALSAIALHPRIVDEPEVTIAPPDTLQPQVSPPVAYSILTPVDLYTPMKNSLPFAALKVNLLYGAVTYTPNMALELGIGMRQTIEIGVSHNRWKHKASLVSNEKMLHWIVRPEYRYWWCERYNGHFIGAHAFYAAYNVSGKDIPLLFEKQYRYHGYAVGGGISYGYHWAFARRWGLEFTLGAGAAHMKYDRFSCRLCDKNAEPRTKTYIGPTRAGVSLVFMIK